ncbi:MAG: AraC family transcriptional regulator [Desulfosarcinaceae bacterium]
MHQDHRRRIHKVMLYLDRNEGRSASVETLARIACFSPFHFQRIFQAITGETVLRYIQRKRLELAARLLCQSSKTIIDIALTVGYQTPAAFNKAFKKWTGETPTSFRQRVTPSQLSSFHPVLRMASVECPPGQPRIECLPEWQFAYLETRGLWEGSFRQSGRPVFQKVYGLVRQHRLDDSAVHWIGMIPYKPQGYDDVQARYRFGVLIEPRLAVPPPLSTMKMAAGRVAIFDHQGPYEYLLQTWAMAYNGWLPRSGEALRDLAPFEIYVNNPDTTPPDRRRTRVCVPIL